MAGADAVGRADLGRSRLAERRRGVPRHRGLDSQTGVSGGFQPAANPSIVQTQAARVPGRAHVLVIGNEKGGSGKSTTALHIAVALMGEGSSNGDGDGGKRDDKKLNEFTIQYSSSIDNPYFTDPQKNRFLMYFDRNVVKNNARDFMHTDVPFWHNFDNEKYEINLTTDQKIDVQEKYTIQESTIVNPYFDFTSRKKVAKNGASIYIDFKPLVNLEIPQSDFEDFRNAHHEIADSNFGIGIDIMEQGLLNMLKYSFKKRLK